MSNASIQRAAIKRLASALGDLNTHAVYVGGATVSLYITDPAAEDIRTTKDIDLTFQVASLANLEKLRQALVDRGFRQSAEDTVLCRFRYEDLIVDVMSTKEVGWAPSNLWLNKGYGQSMRFQLDEISIRLLPLPYFLATKLAAFYDRGIQDVYASHDLEDIVYLLNYSTDLVHQVLNADEEVRSYIQDSLGHIFNDSAIVSAIYGHLPYEHTTERMEILKERINVLLTGK